MLCVRALKFRVDSSLRCARGLDWAWRLKEKTFDQICCLCCTDLMKVWMCLWRPGFLTLLGHLYSCCKPSSVMFKPWREREREPCAHIEEKKKSCCFCCKGVIPSLLVQALQGCICCGMLFSVLLWGITGWFHAILPLTVCRVGVPSARICRNALCIFAFYLVTVKVP